MTVTQEIITAFGGMTVVLSAVAIFTSRLVLNRLNKTWEQKNQLQITQISGEIAKNRQLTDRLLTTLSSGNEQAQEKRIEAIEKIWKSIQERVAFSSGIANIYNILSIEEVKGIYTNQKLDRNSPILDLKNLNLVNFVEKTHKSEIEVELIRPFISTRLWQLYKLHGTFIGRSILLLTNEQSNKVAKVWQDDKAVVGSLIGILSEEEINRAMNLKIGSYNHLISLLEANILKECNLILSGKLAMDNSLDQVIQLEKILKLE